MIYLDYSAATPINKEVLDSFNKVCNLYLGNSNSINKLGTKLKELEDAATKQISDILNLQNQEIIYTSGTSETNNFVIKGIAHKSRGKHIITSKLEHSSIIEPLNYLKKEGFEIDYVNIKKDGLIDLNHLKKLLRNDTILVILSLVDSELGILQPLNEIQQIINKYKNCILYTDATQAIGKINVDFNKIDLISFSANKFYGMNGIGCLIKKENILIEPLIHGGRSSTNYRSGTPNVALIVSMAKALRLVYKNMLKDINYVKELNTIIINKIKKYDKIVINNTKNSIPNIINFSLLEIKAETFLHALEEYEIYISTKSACSNKNEMSKQVFEITKNTKIAESSLRVSLSHLTTKEEVLKFLEIFDICYNKLMNLKRNE